MPARARIPSRGRRDLLDAKAQFSASRNKVRRFNGTSRGGDLKTPVVPNEMAAIHYVEANHRGLHRRSYRVQELARRWCDPGCGRTRGSRSND